LLNKIRLFFEKEMWQRPYSSLVGVKGFVSKSVRISYLTLRSFVSDGCIVRASSLTYFSTMALVPGFALAFVVAKWVRAKEYLEELLYHRFSDHKQFLDTLFSFADNAIDRTKGSVLALFGFALIIWALIRLLSHLENALNIVWQIKKKRSFLKKIRDYSGMMLIGPIFFIASSSVTVFLVSKLQSLVQTLPESSGFGSFFLFLLRMAPYGVIWLLFILLYFLMPSKRVPVVPTLIGSLIAGFFYQGLQWGYITFQLGVTRISGIYGSFAFLPLFMIWMQLSWIIFLFGAEIGFSIDHVKTYALEKRQEFISWKRKKLIYLWLTVSAIEKFISSKFLTKQEVVKGLCLSSELVDTLFEDLVDQKILTIVTEKNQEGYIPAGPYESLKISDVCKVLEDKEGGFTSKESLYSELEISLSSLDNDLANSPNNKLLIDFVRKK